jgi:hypothetical protein
MIAATVSAHADSYGAESSAWDTDSWDSDPNGDIVYGKQTKNLIATWESHGGFGQGCSNTVAWSWIDGSVPPADAPVVISITTYVKWNGSDHSNTCDITTGSDKFVCIADGSESQGNSAFIVAPRH